MALSAYVNIQNKYWDSFSSFQCEINILLSLLFYVVLLLTEDEKLLPLRYLQRLQAFIFSGGGGLVAKSCLTLVIPRTVGRQAPLSMGFSKQEYWSGLPFPSPGDLPDPGIKPGSTALQADDLPTELWGKPLFSQRHSQIHTGESYALTFSHLWTQPSAKLKAISSSKKTLSDNGTSWDQSKNAAIAGQNNHHRQFCINPGCYHDTSNRPD